MVNARWVCQNCGKQVNRTLQKGMCPACYKFWIRHGKLRSEQTMTRLPPGGNQRTCKNCRQGKAIAKELCMTCYTYKKHTGKLRPRNLWIESCKNCRKPRTGPNTIVMGRCRNCYHYWKKHGIERPFKEAKWCDCGQEAVHLGVKLTFSIATGHSYTEEYDLCEACYELEHEPVQTRNEVKWNR